LRATFAYQEAARAAVLALKYNGVLAMAPTMATAMAETLTVWSPPIDAIVPVPLAGMRQRLRGYNQASLLARELGVLTGVSVDSKLLKRDRNTPSQTQQRDAAARRRNVDGAFSLARRTVPERVLLVDDVTTTGATLDACARLLREGGADGVYCLAFSRED
jgi:ComF family protein